MPAPKEVTSVTVSESTRFVQGGGTVQMRTVQYFVRAADANLPAHGPFFVSLPVSEFSEDKVNREMEATVRGLRGIGASVATG